jgi:transposase
MAEGLCACVDGPQAKAAANAVAAAGQHGRRSRETIEAAGAKLRYLPKYSPDLNPIEQAFSKLKSHLRKAAERTIPRLSRRIGALVASFNPKECSNYFRHAGYASA